MGVKFKSKKMIVILGCTLVLLILGFYYFFTHNKSYKNEAIERGDGIYLNGVRYWLTSEPESYTITKIVICTTDSGIKLYELEEYPDYEYIAGYSVGDGCKGNKGNSFFSRCLPLYQAALLIPAWLFLWSEHRHSLWY